VLELLQRGREIKEIAGLVGPEALQDADRLVLESARLVQEQVLGQSAYDPNDAFSPLSKTYRMASLAVALHVRALGALEQGGRFEQLDLGAARRALSAVRTAPLEELAARIADAEEAIRRVGGGASR
jgi:V/A-type H+-transporting ATPase subunit A